MQKLIFSTLSFLILIVLLIVSSNFLNAQQLFSVSQNELSKENILLLKSQMGNSKIVALSLTRDNENKQAYPFRFSSAQNTQIIILNEETGNNVVITPIDESLTEVQLAPFFIEELKQGVLGDAGHYVVVEVAPDFSVKNIASVSASTEGAYIPRYFYGKKEDVKEALPQDRQIINIFKAKPRMISEFPDNLEHQHYIAQLEEEMSYYVYMYKLPDGTLCIHDEHFNRRSDKNRSQAGNNLEFNLIGDMNATQRYVTEYALELWSEQLAGSVPIEMWLEFLPLGSGILGASYRTEMFFDNETSTWYPSTLWNQLVGYDATWDDDIVIVMSSNFNFYFGLDGKTSGYDYVTIMLHEVTHGLGFFSTCSPDDGYFSYSDPGIYDRMLYEGTAGECLTTLAPYERAALLVSNNVYAAGPNLLAANEGNRVKIYAPGTFRPGSSISHWDQTVNNFQTFMKYAYTSPLHTFNTRKIGILTDLGWEVPEIDPDAVWVTFNENGGEGNRPPQPFSPGVAQNLKTNTLTNPGYKFTKWNTEPDGTGTEYADRASLTTSEDLTLYAQWQADIFTLSFDPNGGTVSPKNKTVTFSTPIGELPTPDREGYDFLYWQIAGNPIDEETLWTFAGNRTAIAYWKQIQGIDENKTPPPILIIPNPAEHTIDLRFTIYDLRVNVIEFYNLSGQLVKTVPAGKGLDSQRIDISDLSSGIYMVKVGDSVGRLVVK